MDEIKRALLGDHEAAKRLTDAGVLLPCPGCGGDNIVDWYRHNEVWYQCDDCGETIENPYKAKMKEFCIACHHEVTGTFPWNTTYKTVVDLCDDCFHALREIAKNKEAQP